MAGARGLARGLRWRGQDLQGGLRPEGGHRGHRGAARGRGLDGEATVGQAGTVEGMGELCKSWGLRQMPDVPRKITKFVILC